jgi:cyclic pyranopterin phosphate synthase
MGSPRPAAERPLTDVTWATSPTVCLAGESPKVFRTYGVKMPCSPQKREGDPDSPYREGVTLLTPDLRDARGRALRDLRISVTDRCNFRCGYCMPRELFGADHAFLPTSEVLSVDEVARLVTAFAALGVTKIRLTGGEPLLRPDLEQLIARIRAVPTIDDIAMTTNGALLAERVPGLVAAGLSRVNVSLDSVDPLVFAELADTRVSLQRVLDGIDAAVAAGLGPVKLNAVLQRGRNEDGLLDLVDFARDGGHVLRVIEFMDVGSTNGWERDTVVPSAEVLQRIAATHPLEPVDAPRGDQVAERHRYLDGRGEVGVISSVTAPFCGDCVRARLTAIGALHTCLFSPTGFDLRAPLRSGIDDDALVALVASRWARRDDRYSELRGTVPIGERPEMSYLGG